MAEQAVASDAVWEPGAAPLEISQAIRVCGARVHTLKDIHVQIPRGQLVVLTGPSGSGKSSLAFDTLHAEGQRQYIETLSAYARQFLRQWERPDVDLIEGLPPTLSIDQRTASLTQRSTVATITEIHDYLRLFMARLGQAWCYGCGQPIRQQTPDQIHDRLLNLPEGTKAIVLAPLVRGRKGQHRDVLDQIRKRGLVRVRIDGQIYDLESVPDLNARRKHHVEAVIDRLVIRRDASRRIAESVRLALDRAEGLVAVSYQLPTASDDGPPPEWSDELYSTRYACPSCNISYQELEPRTFSFNSPYGACPVCEGLGWVQEFDPDLVIPDPDRSIEQGAVAPWSLLGTSAREHRRRVDAFLRRLRLSADRPVCDLPAFAQRQLLYGDDESFPGVLVLLEQEISTTTHPKRLAQLERFRGRVRCQGCQGSRLRREAMHVRLGGLAIHEITALSVTAARSFFAQLSFAPDQLPVAQPLVCEIEHRLRYLEQVGLDYLTLDRSADTLSGGELQRVRLATSIGSGLVGVCYILDEPSIGLHPRDNQRLIDALCALRDAGNSVIVVEHDEAMMRQADWLIDLGPGAGKEGGRIVAEGTPRAIADNDESLTGKFLAGRARIEVPSRRRRTAKSRSLYLLGARTNNLKDVNVRIPLGALVCVTGVSGSGKSSLITETLVPALVRRLGGLAPKPGPHTGLRGTHLIDKIIPIDQSPIGRTARSNAATYLGIFDEIRRIFAATRPAKQLGFTASRFSFNVPGGRCEACQGQGVKRIEMTFLPDLDVVCDQCYGSRFNRQTLRVRYRGRSIADCLAMTVDEAAEFFANFAATRRWLQMLQMVGLGYLPLGQPSTTLSAGEAQRVKLAAELGRATTGKTLYVLDEPTTGLHFVDIQRLLEVLNRLVDQGNTVLIIEHHPSVILCADWIVDLGPEGGEPGGRIVAEGTPEQIATVPASHTGQVLARMMHAGGGSLQTHV